MLRFGSAHDPRATAEFVVCDDVGRLRTLDEELRVARSAHENAEARLSVETATGLLLLQFGQWIVYAASDYATGHLRDGRFAKVVGSAAPGVLDVVHPDGSTTTIDLLRFPHVRSAHAISIREARHAPAQAKLLIEVSTPRHAWSASILAADRIGNAIIRVDPRVARNLDAWIARVRRSMPTPWLTDLTPRTDPVAELNALMQKIYRGTPTAERETEKPAAAAKPLEDWLELMSDVARGTSNETRSTSSKTSATPMTSTVSTERIAVAPHQTEIISEDQRRRLHEDLRVTLFASPDTKMGVKRLLSALAPTNDQRDLVAKTLLEACLTNGPTAALVKVLVDQQNQREPDELPAEMTARMPRAWGIWEIYQFKADLRTMAYPSANWPMPLGPIGPHTRVIPRRDARGHFQN
jgi:hypothetical protein